MAEVFGAIASGIGVAGVAAQFADGIRKLCQFCSDVREAPEEVRYAVNELGILTNLLSGMELQLRSQRTQRPAYENLEPVLLFCQQGTQQIAAVFGELNTEMTKRRKRSSLKAAWRKPELDRCLQKIERAKMSLTLAHSMYTSAILTRMDTFEAPLSHLGAPAMIHNASRALSTTSLPNSPQPESRPLGQLVVGTPSDATAPVAGTLVTSQNGSAARLRVKRKPPQTSYTRFRVQPWLLNQVWEFGLHRATRGWDVKLRAYRVVPKDNELFQACTLGRIEEVRSILISGKISAYDKDGNGQDTLTKIICAYFMSGVDFHTEASLKRFCDICRLLIEGGAEVNARWGIGRSLLDELAYFHPPAKSPEFSYSASQAISRLLVSYDLEPDDKNMYAFCASDPGPDLFRLLQEQLWPPWSMRPLDERAKILSLNLLCNYSMSLLSYKAILVQDDLATAWLSCDNTTRDRLTCHFMWPYSHAILDGNQTEIEEYRHIYREVIRRGIDLHNPMPDWQRISRSPMQTFLQAFLFDTQRRRRFADDSPTKGHVEHATWMQIAMTSFITEVQAWGVDLMEYAAKERSINGHTADLETWILMYHPNDAMIHMIDFEYGPRFQDWRVWVSNPRDEWAGEFWEMIEDPERSIPGAWVW